MHLHKQTLSPFSNMHTCDEGVERKKDRYKMMGEERRELKT
jgi:hypothetical protein